MFDVFISYAHNDIEYVSELHSRLDKHGFKVWRDKQELDQRAGWWNQIEEAIMSSDNFVFVISKESLRRPTPHRELIYARQKGKKITTVLCGNFIGKIYSDKRLKKLYASLKVPHDMKGFDQKEFENEIEENLKFLAESQYIDLRLMEDAGQAEEKIEKALKTDRKLTRIHTIVGTRMEGWQEKKERNLLLSGSELKKAKERLSLAERDKDILPRFTSEQRNYIFLSDKNRDRNILFRIILLIIIVIVSVGGLFYAQKQKDIAVENRIVGLSYQLAAQSRELGRENYQLSLLLATQAYRFSGTPESQLALTQLLELEPRIKRYITGDDYSYIYSGVAISPDGSLVAAAIGASNQIFIWDIKTGEQILFHEFSSFEPRDLLFSSDNGYLIATSSRGNNQNQNQADLLIWNLKTDEKLWQKKFNRGPQAMAISPDGKILAVGGDEKTLIVDLSSGKTIKELSGDHSGLIYSLKFDSKGNKLAVGCGEIIVWDTKTWHTLARLSNDFVLAGLEFGSNDDELYSIGYVPALDLINVDTNFQIALWSITERRAINSKVVQEPTHGVYPFFEANTDVLLIVNGTGITLYDPESLTEKEDQLFVRNSSAGYWTQLSDDGKLVTLTADAIVLYDLLSKHRMVETFQPYPEISSQLVRLNWSKAGDMFVTYSLQGSELGIWNSQNRQLIKFLSEEGTVSAAAFSNNGDYLLSISDEGIRLWETTDWELLAGPVTLEASAFTIEFSPQDQWLATGDISGTGRASLFKLPELIKVAEYEIGGGAAFNNIKFLSENEFLITDPIGSVKLIRIQENEKLDELIFPMVGFLPSQGLWDVSGDGNVAASYSTLAEKEMAIGFWDLKNQVQLSETANFKSFSFIPPMELDFRGNFMAFSSCSEKLGDACSVSTLRLWQPDSASIVGEVSVEGSYLFFPEFNEADSTVSISDQRGNVYLWDYGVEALLRTACDIVGRNLSVEEWQNYMGIDIPYEKTCPSFPPGSGFSANGEHEADYELVTVEGIEIQLYDVPSALKLNSVFLTVDKNEQRAETYGLQIRSPLLVIEQEEINVSYRGLIEATVVDSNGSVTKRYQFAFATFPGKNLIFPPNGFRFFNEETRIQFHFIEASQLSLAVLENEQISVELPEQPLAAVGGQVEMLLDFTNLVDSPALFVSGEAYWLKMDEGVLLEFYTGELDQDNELGGLDSKKIAFYSEQCSDNFADCTAIGSIGNVTLLVTLTIEDYEGTEFQKYFEMELTEDQVASISKVEDPAIGDLGNHVTQLGDHSEKKAPNSSFLINDIKVTFHNLPNEIEVGSPFILQCRESQNSDQLVEDFLAAFSLSNNSSHWMNLQATLLLVTENESVVESDSINWELSPFSTGMSLPSLNKSGYVLSGGKEKIVEMRVFFDEASRLDYAGDWSSDFEGLTMSLHGGETYGDEVYPRHRFLLEFRNQDIPSVRDIAIWGLVLNEEGEMIDLVAEWFGEYVAFGGLTQKAEILYQGNSNYYQLVSLSSSGRCVGASPDSGVKTLQTWLSVTAQKSVFYQANLLYDLVLP